MDDESDRYIRAEIGKRFPDHGILSEEDDPKNLQAEYVWVIDPLDGTIPYARGISDHFSVCIALCRCLVPILGVIYCPLRHLGRGEFYFARHGAGSFVVTDVISSALAGFGLSRARKRKIRVSGDDDIHHAIVGLDPGKAPGRTRLPLEVETKLVGDDGVLCVSQHICASVSMALVAAGKMNAYAAARLEPWDMAAATVICREAGAKVTALDGKEWELGDESILIANPVLHGKLLDLLK